MATKMSEARREQLRQSVRQAIDDRRRGLNTVWHTPVIVELLDALDAAEGDAQDDQ